MSLVLIKMAANGFEKVERTSAKMVTGVDGQGWVVKVMMASQNGKKWYKFVFLISDVI